MTTSLDAPFAAHDESFVDVLGDAPRLERVIDTDAHEGPAYLPAEDALYFTTLPGRDGVAIARLQLAGTRFPVHPANLSVVRRPSAAANGMTHGPDGRLVVCEQGSPVEDAAISAVHPNTGDREPLVTSWRGLPLNSPNDVVVARDGSIWFTDPSYGHLQGFRPEPQVGDYVYRHDPATGETAVVADDLDKPNGLAFAPDQSVLYVTDSGANQERGSYYPGRPHHVVGYDVLGGRRLGSRALFAVVTPGFPDGLKVDRAGRVYVSSSAGVQVYRPDGELIGEIALPGAVNFAFGGPAGNVLFITADTAIWAAVLGPTTRGV
jgi:gluconolactonase